MLKARKRKPRDSAIQARNRILDVAQDSFGLNGYEATSLRQIIAEAKVNVAAVNYYFGTKESLYEEVLHRCVDGLNGERIRMLDQCIDAAGKSEPALSEVIRAYVEPFLRLHEAGSNGASIMRFLSRAVNDPSPVARARMIQKMDLIWTRFSPAMQKILPEVPLSTFYWRFYFMISAVYLVGRNTNWLEARTGGLCTLSNIDEVIAELSGFLVHGMSAPPQRIHRRTAAKAKHRDAVGRAVAQRVVAH